MSKIITQKAEENKQISERIKSFMKRFEVSSALKSSNAVKIKGFAVIEIFQYLFMLVFAHRSIYMDMKRDTVPFAKDTVYRFLNSARINWLKFTTRLSAKIIEEAIEPLTSEQRKNVLIIDDSVFKNFIATGQAPILVFAPVDLTFNELRMQLEPFRATHKNVFVFVGKKILD